MVDWAEAIHQTILRLGARWVPAFDGSADFYDYIPYAMRDFVSGMDMAATATEGRRFLEVGCGIGTKLALMQVLGWQVAGIDRYEPYIRSAKELVPEADFVAADMRDVPFFDADVVFMYHPAVNDDVEAAMEKHLVDSVAPGTVLFVPPETLFFWSLGLERLGPHLWRR